jgi:cysteine synthase
MPNQKFSTFKSFPLEPGNAAIMYGSRDLKEHKIQGIGDNFMVKDIELLDLRATR